MATDTPSSTPDTNPPERVVDTLSGLREEVKQANELHEVTGSLVDRTLAALEDARKQAMTIGEAARDGLRGELAQWNLDHVPTVLKDALETTKITVEDIYQKFQDNTVPFAQTNIEKGIGTVTKMINTLSDTVNMVQEFLAKHLSKLLPSLMTLGIPVPEWLLPKGKGMKELFAALNANERKFQEGPKDDENMREVAKIHSVLNGKKAMAERTSLEVFLTSVVEQSDSKTDALTTQNILESAQGIAKAPPAPVSTPAAAAPDTPAVPAGPAPAPAATA